MLKICLITSNKKGFYKGQGKWAKTLWGAVFYRSEADAKANWEKHRGFYQKAYNMSVESDIDFQEYILVPLPKKEVNP